MLEPVAVCCGTTNAVSNITFGRSERVDRALADDPHVDQTSHFFKRQMQGTITCEMKQSSSRFVRLRARHGRDDHSVAHLQTAAVRRNDGASNIVVSSTLLDDMSMVVSPVSHSIDRDRVALSSR